MGQLRIIAGELRGRRIAVPRGTRIRPTRDRVREALFSILGSVVAGSRVLDAYSGTGALGFEALSRGALFAVFIEADRKVMAALAGNAERLGVESRCTLLTGKVHETIGRRAAIGPFELILADPPYAAGQGSLFLPHAVRCLADGGLIVVERDSRIEPPAPEPFDLERSRTARYGASCLDFYHRRGHTNPLI